MIYKYQIDKELIDKFIILHKSIFSLGLHFKNVDYEYYDVSYLDFDKNASNDDEIMNTLNILIQYIKTITDLEDINYFTVRFERYNFWIPLKNIPFTFKLKEKERNIKHTLTYDKSFRHKDNNMNYSKSVLIYLRIDKGLPRLSFCYESKNKNVKSINVKENDIIIYPSNTKYSHLPLYGIGKLDLIRVYFS